MKEEHKIYTGESQKVKVGFLNSIRLIYSGMPSEGIFSLTPLLTDMHGGYAAPIIYYPKGTTKIYIMEHRFKVKEVTPNYIILTAL